MHKFNFNRFLLATIIFCLSATALDAKPKKETLFLTLFMHNDSLSVLSSSTFTGKFRYDEPGNTRVIKYQAKGKNDEVLLTGQFCDPSIISFDDKLGDGPIQGGATIHQDMIFTVRIPYLNAMKSIKFYKNKPIDTSTPLQLGEIDLSGGTRKLSATLPSPLRMLISGDSLQKLLNLVVLSEGYTQAELSAGKFINDIRALINSLFATTPFKEYAPYYNVWAISVASSASGVGGFFGSQLNNRALTLNIAGSTAIANLLQQLLPDYDAAMVLVNSAQYAGTSQGAFAIATTAAAGEIAGHELGHAFAMLGDEYDIPGSTPFERPNTSQHRPLAQIKWAPWISNTTPIPTPETVDYASVVGLFEGAAYSAAGWFRPKLDCAMKSRDVPFCEVCTETIIARQYLSVSPIDAFFPGSLSLDLAAMPAKRLVVTPLQPIGRTVTTEWYCNGIKLPGRSDTLDLLMTPLVEGTNTVRAIAADKTPMVRIPGNLPLLRDTVTWMVTSRGTGTSVQQAVRPVKVSIMLKGKCAVALSLPQPGPVRLSVYGLDGRTVFHRALQPPDFRVSIPVNGLSRGAYLVRVSDENGLTVARRQFVSAD